MILDQATNVLDDKTEPAEKPDQRALHYGAAILNLLVPTDLKRARMIPMVIYRSIRRSFCCGTALPECLRDRKREYFNGA